MASRENSIRKPQNPKLANQIILKKSEKDCDSMEQENTGSLSVHVEKAKQ